MFFEDTNRVTLNTTTKLGQEAPVVWCKPTQELVVLNPKNISKLEDIFNVKHSSKDGNISINVPRTEIEVFSTFESFSSEVDSIKNWRDLDAFPFSKRCKGDFASADKNKYGIYFPVNINQELAEDSPVIFFSRDGQRGAIHLYTVDETKSLLREEPVPRVQAECEIIRGTDIQSSCGFGFYIGTQVVENIAKQKIFAAIHLLMSANQNVGMLGELQYMTFNLIKPGKLVWEGPFASMLNERAGHRKMDLEND